ncbi:MAG: A24 family peptidase [Phycisphaerae bacterium]
MTPILPDNYWTLAVLVVPAATVYASVIDYRERRVPNWLNATLAAFGIVAQASYFGTEGVKAAFLGMLVGFGMLIVPWMMHGMGAGDVKLMAAVGAWFGPWLTLLGGALGILIGGVIAVVMILVTGKAGQAKANLGVIVAKCCDRTTVFSEFGSTRSFGSKTTLLPYGIPLTMGSLVILGTRYFEWAVLL